MTRSAYASSFFLACLLVVSACKEDKAAQSDGLGPVQTQEDGPVALRDTADQFSDEIQEAARHVRHRADALRNGSRETLIGEDAPARSSDDRLGG